MRLLDSIGRGFRMLAEWPDPPDVKRDPFDPRWWGMGGQMSVAGVAVTADNVLQLGAVQTVLTGIGGSIKTLPWMVFEKGPDQSRNALATHPLTILLGERPNDFQTAAEFRDEIVQHCLFWRNSYCKILPGVDYAIGGLEIYHPQRLQKIERRGGRRYYSFSRLPPETGIEVLRDDEVWHVRIPPLTRDGLRGRAMFETAREVFGRALAVKQYGDIWFKNFGATGGYFEHPGNFKTKDDREEWLANMREQSTGSNRHRDKLLINGIKYNQLKVTNAEAQLLETEQSSETEIFGLWGYPPSRASRLQRATFSNIEQQSIDYVVHAVTPVVVAIEQSAKHDLLLDPNPERYVADFNLAGLMRGDIATRYKAYAIGRQWGWLSADDVLRLENMNPLPNGQGKIYMMPVNMAPAGENKNEPGNRRQPATPGDDEQLAPPLDPNPDDERDD
jgi:HK97 family phage portal protein